MTGNGVHEQATVQIVVDLAFTVRRAVVVTRREVVKIVTVGTICTAVEVPEIRLQDTWTDCPVVHQTEEVLLIEIFQVAVVVLGSKVFGDFVVTTTVDELVAIATSRSTSVSTSDRQLFVVAGVTAFGVLDLTTDQCQVFDLVRSDLTALERLRQQTSIVGYDDWQFRLQGTQSQFGLGDFGFGSQAQAGEVINCFAVGLAWKNGTAVGVVTGAVSTATRIQTYAQQADGVDTEADGALGITGGETQIEALAPFFVLVRARTITVISIDVEVTQPQSGLAVFDKTGGACLLRHNPYGHGQGQGGLVHCFAPLRF
ncbi:hypothetical protein D3C73_903410 [compost metagenome]